MSSVKKIIEDLRKNVSEQEVLSEIVSEPVKGSEDPIESARYAAQFELGRREILSVCESNARCIRELKHELEKKG